MILHLLRILGVLWLLHHHAAGQSTFDTANQAYSAGDYAAAAAGYEALLTAEGPRASVYYNLGNSYQKLKRPGHAILAYERARLITPRDPDLAANLTRARKSAAAFDESGMNPRLEAVLGYLSRHEWSWVTAGCALALGVCVFIATVFRPGRSTRQALGVISVLALLAGAGGATALWLRRDEAARGIVLTPNAAVRLSPFADADSVGTAGVGHSVRLLESRAGFRYIEIPNASLKGWISATDVAAIQGE